MPSLPWREFVSTIPPISDDWKTWTHIIYITIYYTKNTCYLNYRSINFPKNYLQVRSTRRCNIFSIIQVLIKKEKCCKQFVTSSKIIKIFWWYNTYSSMLLLSYLLRLFTWPKDIGFYRPNKRVNPRQGIRGSWPHYTDDRNNLKFSYINDFHSIFLDTIRR